MSINADYGYLTDSEAAEYCNYPDLSPVSAGFLGWFEFCSPARRGNAILTTHGVHGALGNVTTVGTGSCDCRAVAGRNPHLWPG